MTYKDLTIKQYKQVQRILNSDDVDMIKTARLIAYLKGGDSSAMTANDIKEGAHLIEFLKEDGGAYRLRDRFRLKGRRFTVVLDARSVPFGKYIDLMNTLKTEDEEETQQHIIDNMDKLMALLVVERTRFKKHLDYNELCELFNEYLTMDIVLPVTVFFSKVSIALIPHMVDYLERMAGEMQTAEGTHNIGVGS
jgi:hypothetical protein